MSATGKDLKRRIYIWSEEGHLKAFTQLANGQLGTAPVVNMSVAIVSGMPGGILSLSSKPGNGGDVIVWATHPLADAFVPTKPVQGVLFAFDGADVTKLLWSSAMTPGDALGEYPKSRRPPSAMVTSMRQRSRAIWKSTACWPSRRGDSRIRSSGG